MSKLKAVNGHAILKPVEIDEMVAGNIIIPDLGKEKPEIGEVLEVSSTYNWNTGEYVKPTVEVGDKVLIPKLGSQRMMIDNEEYYITKVSEIIAIIK
jgi:chaperonin GroES